MEKLTSRERFTLALDHKEPDRVPIDLGSITSTIRTVEAYDRLKEYLGIALDQRIRHFADEHIVPDEEILKALHVDTWYVRLNTPKTWQKVRLDPYTIVDEWGVPWSKPPGSLYTSPVLPPLKNPALEEIAKHPWPDPDEKSRFDGLREKTLRLFEETDYAIVADGLTGVGVFDMAWRLRGMEDLLMDMILHPEFTEALFQRLTDFYVAIYRNYMQTVGDFIQMLIYYEDLSGQDGPSDLAGHVSEIRETLPPPDFSGNPEIHRAKLCVHICGSAWAFLDDFVELGVDVLNPVQTSARDMEPQRLKDRYGSVLSFHGGIDTQHFLPKATPQEVKEEVRRMIRILGKGGGYLFTSCHSIQPDVSPQNIVALFSAAAEYRKIPAELKGRNA